MNAPGIAASRSAHAQPNRFPGTIRRLIWGLSLLLALPAGCTRLTYENWERIEDGMDAKEVEAILGEPTFPPTDYTWIYTDDERGLTATVYFTQDLVSGKSWADVEHGMVGNNPNVMTPGESETVRARSIE